MRRLGSMRRLNSTQAIRTLSPRMASSRSTSATVLRPFAEKIPRLAERVGIPNHRQEIVFSGGASGAPMALWQDDEDRNAAQAILDGGDVDVLVMICCSEGWLETADDQGIVNWIDYALEQNPNTRFALAFPWPDFPERYDSASFNSRWDEGYTMWKQTIDTMRSRYDGVEIFSIPHGRASTQLWNLFDAGELPEVSAVRGPGTSSIFTDRKGHAGDIFKNMGATIWVGAIYGVDVSEMTYGVNYETDIAGMAQAIVAADDYTRTP